MVLLASIRDGFPSSFRKRVTDLGAGRSAPAFDIETIIAAAEAFRLRVVGVPPTVPGARI